MRTDPDDEENPRDWRISAILATVWILAMIYIVRQDTGIPDSMLLVASLFFFMLIPAMNDLVRSIERALGGSSETPDNKG